MTLFVRPVATAGSFGRRVIETDFVQGTIVGGATGVVRWAPPWRGRSRPATCAAYALLLLLGMAGLTLYFLLNSS